MRLNHVFEIIYFCQIFFFSCLMEKKGEKTNKKPKSKRTFDFSFWQNLKKMISFKKLTNSYNLIFNNIIKKIQLF